MICHCLGLCSLPGVGPKVADCVCLMSLDKHDAIPIDTHIWQIAVRDYLPHLKKMKTITDKSYREIGKDIYIHVIIAYGCLLALPSGNVFS